MNRGILVVGASGNIGAQVARLLDRDGKQIKTASRHPARLTKLANAAPNYFDFDDPDSWPEALKHVSHLFMIPKVGDPYPDQTIIPFIDRAIESGVRRIVFSTAMGLDKDWRVLAVAEQHLIDSGVGSTILRPGWFMQNFNPGFLLTSVRAGTIRMPGLSSRISFIDTRDIARAAVTALFDDSHAGKAYTLTGSESLSWEDTARTLSAACGRDISYIDTTIEEIRDNLLQLGEQPYRVEQMVQMLRATENNLYADISQDVNTVTGQDPIRFLRFAEENAGAWR